MVEPTLAVLLAVLLAELDADAAPDDAAAGVLPACPVVTV
jgi:hypothetical protein